MPLNQKVTFQGLLEACYKIQVPSTIRGQFKLETNQILKIGVNIQDGWKGWQYFSLKLEKTVE